MSVQPLRIAILTHSTNPRGGVVHALELAGALAALGHEPVVHAPDAGRRGFFRPTPFETALVPASTYSGGTAAMVRTRIADYIAHFERPQHRRFDIYHAQDSISANALAGLKGRRLIHGFARTVHHLDSFADPQLTAWQQAGVVSADRLFVVSNTWQAHLRERLGLPSALVGNGVDLQRFTPDCDGREEALRERLGLGEGPIFVGVGGIEERKNTQRVLEAFLQVRRLQEGAQLVIAGGASLLDHSGYRAGFDALLAEAGLPAGAVVVTGTVPDADMPALYRLANTLVFPSLKEGFGLCVLEAMASGIPVVTSAIPPFTEYLSADDAVWCDPRRPGSIADAMAMSLVPALRERAVARGHHVAQRHSWCRAAEAHLAVYQELREPSYA